MQKEYTKPVVTRVNLVPAEATLTYCKYPGDFHVSGPGYGTCCDEWQAGSECLNPGS